MATQIVAPAETAEYHETSPSRRKPDAWPVMAPRRGAMWLTLAFGLIAAVASLGTLVLGVLRGTAVMNGSARGTALVVLVAAVPILMGLTLLTGRSVLRGQIARVGVAAFLTYNAVMFLLGTPFNQLFLIYAAMFALGVASIILTVREIDLDTLPARFSAALPSRGIAAYILVIVALNASAWLRNVVPAVLSSTPPAWLNGTGLTTNPVYVQDLSFWLPLMSVGAVLLWRRHAWGFLLAGVGLTMWVLESVAVSVDQWWGHAADPGSTVASAAVTPVFAALAVVGLIPLVTYFRNLDRT